MSGIDLKVVALEPQINTHKPNSLIAGTGAAVGNEQWERSVKLISFVVDQTQGSKGISFLSAWPGMYIDMYVCKGSTAMAELVGFKNDDLCDRSDNGGPTLGQMIKQNPFLAPDGTCTCTMRPVVDRTLHDT